MNTKQTIDGVPRELLEDMLNPCADFATHDRLRAMLDAPAPCTHEWTDDGGHLLACTACGAQEDHAPGWRDMATAPIDGTMLRLLVEFEEHSTEDAEQAPTIGANNFENDGEDVWRFAGWCWSHDHFTGGKGVPVGWLPMFDGPKLIAAAEQPAPVAAPLDYGSLDAVQRLAVCRGDVLPASAAPSEPDRIKGMVETIGGQYAVMIDPENGHYGWTFKKHPDGQWVSGRKATEREMIAARSHAQITNQL